MIYSRQSDNCRGERRAVSTRPLSRPPIHANVRLVRHLPPCVNIRRVAYKEPHHTGAVRHQLAISKTATPPVPDASGRGPGGGVEL